MSDQKNDSPSNGAWFVGASFGGTDDQTQRFISDGVWEVKDPTDKQSALVRSMQPGERIVVKGLVRPGMQVTPQSAAIDGTAIAVPQILGALQ